MQATNYNGHDIYLLDNQPDWVSGVRADVEVVSDLTRSLSNREGRRAYAATLRFKLAYRSTAIGREARWTADSLRSYQTQPIAMPFWPGAVLWQDRATMPITGGLKIVFRQDFAAWGLYEAVEPDWAVDGDFVAPVLWGRLEKRELTWLDAHTATFDVQFVETGPAAWALQPAIQAWDNGPLPGDAYDTPPKLLPFGLDFEAPKLAFNVSIIREQIGFGREPQETLYAQTNARQMDGASALLSAGDVAAVLRFFQEHGPAPVFWALNVSAAAVLTADIGALDVVLQVEDTKNVRVGDFLAFLTADGIQASARVANRTGGTITVDVAPGPMQRGLTTVAQLCLCRFDKTRLALNWAQPGLAGVSLPVVEVPPEYDPAADEEIGTSLGELPARCYLYEFSRVLGGATFTDRFTSYEANLTFGGQQYTAQKIDHKEIRQGLQLDADEVTLDASIWTANPLLLLATLKMEAPLFLVIRQADVNGALATNGVALFSGELVSVSVKGSVLTAKAVSGGTMFDRRVPRVLFQRSCNNSLFDVGCGLAKADWKFTATVADPGSSTAYPFELSLSGLDRDIGADPAYTENWFAGGWLEAGEGLNWQRRAILLSTLPDTGDVTVTLDRAPDPDLEVGQEVVLYPGCDLLRLTCINKFDNYLNFLGHPFLPLANPSLVKRDQATSGGKK